MTRILDIYNNELVREDIDFSLGYVVPEEIFVKHHEAIESTEEIYHYQVKTFYFEDGTKMEIESSDDPHVKIIDSQAGRFEYVDQGEGKVFRGADISKIIDIEAVEGKDAWDEYETIERFIEYTPEEIATQKAEAERVEKQHEFIVTGPDRLTNTELSLDDLILLMAEMIGA